MILYFSATGNSKHVAERLAEATGDSIASIPEYADEKRNCVDLEGGMLGIVCPVFFGGLPRLVENYLEDLVARDASYVYFVGTYGGYSGQAGLYAKYLLARNGIKLDARFGVKMPGTFSPGYRVDDAEKNARRNAAAEEQIEMVAQAVCAHARGDLMSDELPLFVADAMHAAYAPVSRTRFFSVNETCIGCGKCAEKCPDHAIEMRDGRPVWVKDHCDICMGCVHRCPAFAISFTRLSARNGHYLNPHTTV